MLNWPNLNLILLLSFFCLFCFQNFYHLKFQIWKEILFKNSIKTNIIKVSSKLEFTLFLHTFGKFNLHFPHSAIQCNTSPSTQFFPTLSFSSSSFSILIITIFSFVILFVRREINLGNSFYHSLGSSLMH